MKKAKLGLNILVLSCIYMHSARAEIDDTNVSQKSASGEQQAQNQDANAFDDQLDEMVVSATRSELKAVLAPANPTVINDKNTQNRLGQRIGDALLEAPGVYMRGSAYGTSVPGSGMGGVSIHGVTDARRSLFMVDGLPVNSGASNNVDFNTLDMNGAKQVEFVPGPFSALYGSSAMGGVINVITQEPTKREGSLTAGGGGGAADQWGVKGKYLDRFENGLGISLTYGHMDSSNWSNMDPVIVSPSGAPAVGAKTVYGAVPASTDSSGAPATGYLIGYKGARNWSQDNASLHLFQDITEHTKLDGGMAWTRSVVTKTTPINLLTTSDGSPLVLGTTGNNSNPSFNLNIGGKAQHLYESTFLAGLPQIEDTRRYFGHLKHDFGSDIKLNADFQYMENTYDYAITSTPDTYSSGAGQASSQPNHRIDGNLGLRFPLLWKDRNFMTVGFGYNRNVLDASQKAATSNWTDLNSITAINTLGKGQSTILSGYIQDELYIKDNLIAYLGGRYDDWITSGSFMQTSPVNYNATYNSRGQGQFNPKFGLTWLPDDGYKFFASAGWAFRPPTMLDLYSTTVSGYQNVNGVSTPIIKQASPDLKPETMFNFEFGGEIKPFSGTTFAASYFQHFLSDLIYTQRTSPIQQLIKNAGAAHVEGVELKLKQQLYWDWLHFTGTYTLNNSEVTSNTADTLSVGKAITLTPKTMFTGSLDINYDKWSGGIIGRYVGKAYGNQDNTDTLSGVYGSYDPYFLVDTRLKFQATKNIGVSFSLNNLLDRNYFAYYQQAGRTFYGDISYSF